MKQAFRLLCLAAVLGFFWLSYNTVKAQSTSTTPDSFVAQVSNGSSDSFANDINGNGRFVVIQSTADIATEKTASRNNADLNREIFLYDYAQRRIFQITNTQSAIKVTASPTPTPSPSPSPTASPITVDPNTIQYEVSNNHPMISNDGKWIVFMSNATTPGNFNGNTAANSAALAADGNQEIWLYRIPDVAAADLTAGTDLPVQDLTTGTFTRITNTPASQLPRPGSSTTQPFVAFDNRDPTINDDGTIISFVSGRDIVAGGNADGSPEVYITNRSGGTPSFVQVTTTPLLVKGNLSAFTENPSLSGDGRTLAFISNANLTGNNTDVNAEIYVVKFNGTAVTGTTQVTNTTADNGASVNLLSPGRRLSRNGNFIAFESRADLTGTTGLQAAATTFLYDIGAATFKQIGPRPTTGVEVGRFPTFTGDSSTLIFSSALNFDASGTIVTSTTSGLNPNTRVQLFSVPVSSPGTTNVFSILTNTPAPISNLTVPQIQAYASNSIRRIAFSVPGIEFGTGNSDSTVEAYYLLLPAVTSDVAASANAVAFFTGASLMPVVGPSPAPAAPNVAGLAPGELGIIRPTGTPAVSLAPSAKNACAAQTAPCATVTGRRPPLPVELNGVSVSVGNAAAGLYFVSPGQINFVVPPGLAASSTAYPVVINNNGAVIRATLTIVAAQPDIVTTANGPGGRAAVTTTAGTTEPFSVTTTGSSGAAVATVLVVRLTGVQNITSSQVTVRIGTIDITGSTNILFVGPTDTPGFDQINVTLPASLAGAGDVPIIVTVTPTGGTFASRPADTAPRIRIL